MGRAIETQTVKAVNPAGQRRMRVDAERNRQAILQAAREIFAQSGLEAPLEEIAERAGVGIATLYRRFPSRKALVSAALIAKVTEYERLARQCLEVQRPTDGFSIFVERACALQVADRGLSDLLSMTLPLDAEVEQLRMAADRHVTLLIERAKAAGVLRADFVAEDLLLLLIANAAIIHVTADHAPGAWRRFSALVLGAFQTHGPAPLPEAPTAAQMASSMRRAALEHGCGGRA